MDRKTRLQLSIIGLHLRGIDAEMKAINDRECWLKLDGAEETLPWAKAEGRLLDRIAQAVKAAGEGADG